MLVCTMYIFSIYVSSSYSSKEQATSIVLRQLGQSKRDSHISKTSTEQEVLSQFRGKVAYSPEYLHPKT